MVLDVVTLLADERRSEIGIYQSTDGRAAAADNLPRLQDRIKTLRLRVFLDGWQDGDVVTIAANGQPLTTVVEKPGWLAATLSPSFVKQGANVIAVNYEQGESKSLTITSVELTVQYDQPSPYEAG